MNKIQGINIRQEKELMIKKGHKNHSGEVAPEEAAAQEGAQYFRLIFGCAIQL